MHRTLIAGLSLLALTVVAGCAQDDAMTTSNAGSGSSGQDSCSQWNFNPRCTDASRMGMSGSGALRGTTDLGGIDDPNFRAGSSVPPQNRRMAGNRPGAGVPMEPPNSAPSLSPGTLSGDAGKRTTGETGGN
ncbi:MAG TPA: hypothetical protein VD860_13675 [Azospirillum sp.]|nr:hypothetical protein [Azospirillum sp.]